MLGLPLICYVIVMISSIIIYDDDVDDEIDDDNDDKKDDR